MYWDITKKAWELARETFPKVRSLYVAMPSRLSRSGTCKVYDLASKSEIGEMSYDFVVANGEPKAVVEMMPRHKEAALSRHRPVSAKISWSTCQPAQTSLFHMLRGRYGDPFEIGALAARICVSGQDIQKTTKDAIREWMASSGFPTTWATPVLAGMESLGIAVHGPDDAFNLRMAKNKDKYDVNEKVRVNNPMSMEYQECGRVLESRGNAKDGTWYLVMVDGSGIPRWFAEEEIGADEAGAIVGPIPVPVGHAETDA